MSDAEIQGAVIRHAQVDLANVPAASSAPNVEYTGGEAVGAFFKGLGAAAMAAAEKLIPQGAAELGQGLFTGNAYVPYGPTEMSVPMVEMGQDAHLAEYANRAPAIEAPSQGMEH